MQLLINQCIPSTYSACLCAKHADIGKRGPSSLKEFASGQQESVVLMVIMVVTKPLHALELSYPLHVCSWV